MRQLENAEPVRIFRYFLTASWALSIVGVVIDFATWDTLPPLLREYWWEEATRENNMSDMIALYAGIPLVPLVLVSYIGLYRFWRHAPGLFVVSNLAGWVVMFFIGPNVSTTPADVLYDLATTSGGIVIGMAYFSPVSNLFKHET